MDEVRFNRIISWGQYIHWADIQYKHFKENLHEDTDRSSFTGLFVHFLAAQYVVIEGWIELKEDDKSINQLLSKYSDFVEILRKCRNAVYHYQDKIFDKRIQNALDENEFLYWITALKEEFERYLYLYTFKICGMSIESIELQNQYFGCIGWKPKNNLWVKWFELYYMCLHYTQDHELNELEINEDNNLLISKTYSSLSKIRPDCVTLFLTRIN